MNKTLAWHFMRADENGNAILRDNRIVKAGDVISVDGELKLCEWGLHASLQVVDALEYAPGSIIARVEQWGDIQHGEDKLVSRHRQILWMADATNVLHEFAFDVAERAFLEDNPADERSWKAIRTKRLWMDGKASSAELDAASEGAMEAAKDAIWSDLISARLTALGTANAFAWVTVREAARGAALVVDWSRAWGIDRATQNKRLEAMLMALAPEVYME